MSDHMKVFLKSLLALIVAVVLTFTLIWMVIGLIYGIALGSFFGPLEVPVLLVGYVVCLRKLWGWVRRGISNASTLRALSAEERDQIDGLSDQKKAEILDLLTEQDRDKRK